MGLTTQLQYCMASFLQQNLKYKNRHKARKMDGVVHREVRDDGPVSCTKLYLLCSNFFFFFFGKHIKRDPRPTIIWLHKHMISTGYNWPRYPKYSANQKARRLTSFYKMRNWDTKRLNDLSETTWKLLSLGLMTSPPEHPSPSLTLKYQMPAGQAAAEPAISVEDWASTQSLPHRFSDI